MWCNRFASSKSGKIYLHTDIRVIFARDKFELDSRVANYELRSFTEGPENPKYAPRRQWSVYRETVRLRSHRHECEYESESGFPFTGCVSLVQASPARVERSLSLVQAHNSTHVYWQSPVKSIRVNALWKM